MRNEKSEAYLVAGAAVDGPAFELPRVDSRFDGSALLSTVLTLVRNLPTPFFFSSFGTDGPAWAGELMFA